MTTEADFNHEPQGVPDAGRRQLNAGLLVALAGGLGMAATAQAFPRSAPGQFNAASRILAPYGVTVSGDNASGHDRLRFDVAPLPDTEYTQVVGAPNRQGGIDPRWATSVHGDDAVATHFHPGEIIPCIRTTIEDDRLATHELFDADQGGRVPCFKVESEMLAGGHFRNITATHFHDGAIVPCVKTTIAGHALATHEVFDTTDGVAARRLAVATEMGTGGALGGVKVALDPRLASFELNVGDRTYRLVGGELLEVTDTPR